MAIHEHKGEYVLMKDTFSTHVMEFLLYGSQDSINWIRSFKKNYEYPDYLELYFKQDELDLRMEMQN